MYCIVLECIVMQQQHAMLCNSTIEYESIIQHNVRQDERT